MILLIYLRWIYSKLAKYSFYPLYMQLYEQEDKGLFTFYREQDEYEQYMKRRLNDLQTSKLQDLSNMKGEREKTNPIKKRKLQK